MKITTKSRYAIRSIFALVLMGGDERPIALTQVAEHEDISRKYLEQIFIKLKKIRYSRRFERSSGRIYACQSPT